MSLHRGSFKIECALSCIVTAWLLASLVWLGLSPAEKSPDTSKKQEAMLCVIHAAAPHQMTDCLDITLQAAALQEA